MIYTQMALMGWVQMGVSVNSTAFSAKLITAVAFDPRLIAPMLFGDGDDTQTYVQDSSALARVGEKLSWWQLMVRVSRAPTPTRKSAERFQCF